MQAQDSRNTYYEGLDDSGVVVVVRCGNTKPGRKLTVHMCMLSNHAQWRSKHTVNKKHSAITEREYDKQCVLGPCLPCEHVHGSCSGESASEGRREESSNKTKPE
jgi:hypothetical protein